MMTNQFQVVPKWFRNRCRYSTKWFPPNRSLKTGWNHFRRGFWNWIVFCNQFPGIGELV